MHIRITKTPPGAAPRNVRKMLVGLELPVIENEATKSGTAPEFHVYARDATRALENSGLDDAARHYGLITGRIAFPKGICQIIQ